MRERGSNPRERGLEERLPEPSRMAAPRAARRVGFTLIELVLALGLFAVLCVALVRLLDTSLTIWARTESERDLIEMGGAVLDLVAADVHGLEGGPRGDLVAEWRRFDLDGDGVPSLLWPRITLVRRASPAEWRRTEDVGALVLNASGQISSTDPRRAGLIEVCWALLPDRGEDLERRGVGVLWRGERRVGADSTSFFDPRFFDASNRPLAGTLEPLTGGVLWFEPRFATQTSILTPGETRAWNLGESLADCAASWDAFGRFRPNQELSFLNAPGAGMPEADGSPILPRRVRVTLELERPSDLKYRTRLAFEVLPDGTELIVRNDERIPPPGALVLVNDEWMEVGARGGGSVSVLRGRRGTRAGRHLEGSLVHFGAREERELVVPGVREDWNL